MKVTVWRSVDRLRASSDLDEKLVTIWSLFGPTPRAALLGTSIELIGQPDGLN